MQPASHAERLDLPLAIRRARRHSRFVRALKVGLPLCVAVLLAAQIASFWFGSLRSLPGLSIDKMAISGTRITMNMPRLTGFSTDGRAYELTAGAAAQDLRRPQFVELTDIRSRMQLAGGSTVTVTASTGVYDTKSEQVVLRDDVLVATSDATEVRLAEAVIDMRKGHVLSHQPVEVLMQRARILGNRMEVENSGEKITFRGGVTMHLQPEMSGGSPAGAQRSQAPAQIRAEAVR